MAAEQHKQLKVVEFYSGIGGMHYALKSSGAQASVVAAIDINTTANEVYAHNFPDTMLLNRNIEGIRIEYFVKLDADVFLMSPPCQPFTRQGHQKASHDARTKSFLYILEMLRRLPKPPRYILMENVKGFETSDTRQEFIRTLKETNYIYQEFLLSPTQFAVPNSRLRYFLIAVQKPMVFPFQTTELIMDNFPVNKCQDTNKEPSSLQRTDNPRNCCMICSKMKNFTTLEKTNNLSSVSDEKKEESCENNASSNCVQSSTVVSRTVDHNSQCLKEQLVCHQDKEIRICNEQTIRIIKDFLEVDTNNPREFLVPENILRNKVLLMDIVQEDCNHSCCFTKGYGHYIEGTGSVLQGTNVDPSEIFSKYNEVNEHNRVQLLAPLGLRYFTPREISNIHCFPKDFDFPKTISTKQKYRLLGNSLNVFVLAELMKLLFTSKIP